MFDRLRMQRLRRAVNLRCRGLARLAGCDEQTIERIEAGVTEPGAELVAKLARALGVAMEMLHDGQDEQQEVCARSMPCEAGEGLSEEESQMLQVYRRLSDRSRGKVLGFMMGLDEGLGNGAADSPVGRSGEQTAGE